MPGRYSTTRSFPFLESLTTKERQLAERAFVEQNERRRQASDARGRRIDQLSERVQRDVRNALGAREFKQLRDAIRAERLSFRNLFEPPEGLKRDYAKETNAARRRIDALKRKLKAGGAKVSEIVRAADAQLEALLLPDTRVVAGFNLRNNFAKWTDLSPLHTYPLPWGPPPLDGDPNDPHRWFLFRPPFFGFLFSDNIVTSDHFNADRLLVLHPPSGLVGNIATMDCGEADNWDLAHVIGEAQIAFAFTPPTAGVIEVLIDAQSTIGTHHVKFEDEWGFSEAWCYQHSYLMMNVLHPNVPESSLALMSNMDKRTGGDDLTADEEHLTRGQHYFAQLFSSGPVPAGQSVIITAGARTMDICRANDMELHSRSDFQWFISSVEVRIAP
jgi:hypothetical protein